MNELNGYDIEDLSPHMHAAFSKTVEDADIVHFAEISGDHNPVHLDDAFAATTRFRGRIAHGMLTAGIVSAAIANRLPGPGTVYLSQQVRFLAPVRPGNRVDVTVTIRSIDTQRGRVVLETTCRVGDEIVLEGMAEVKPTSAAKRHGRLSSTLAS